MFFQVLFCLIKFCFDLIFDCFLLLLLSSVVVTVYLLSSPLLLLCLLSPLFDLLVLFNIVFAFVQRFMFNYLPLFTWRYLLCIRVFLKNKGWHAVWCVTEWLYFAEQGLRWSLKKSKYYDELLLWIMLCWLPGYLCVWSSLVLLGLSDSTTNSVCCLFVTNSVPFPCLLTICLFLSIYFLCAVIALRLLLSLYLL